MRLIDADALRDHAFEVYHGNGVELETLMVVPLAEIDNAPKVEYTFEEAFQKTVCEQRLYCTERPKGKWIFRQGVTCGGYYKCNKCGEVERAEKNFCPNCGADMRGKEE